MDRHITWIVVGTCFACLAVILGAFAAHGLTSKISTEETSNLWKPVFAIRCTIR